MVHSSHTQHYFVVSGRLQILLWGKDEFAGLPRSHMLLWTDLDRVSEGLSFWIWMKNWTVSSPSTPSSLEVQGSTREKGGKKRHSSDVGDNSWTVTVTDWHIRFCTDVFNTKMPLEIPNHIIILISILHIQYL